MSLNFPNGRPAKWKYIEFIAEIFKIRCKERIRTKLDITKEIGKYINIRYKRRKNVIEKCEIFYLKLSPDSQ